jgi:hypothetical protein
VRQLQQLPGTRFALHVVWACAGRHPLARVQSGSPSYCSSHRLVNFSGSRLDGSKTHRSMSGEVIHGAYFRQSAFATKVTVTVAASDVYESTTMMVSVRLAAVVVP